MKRHKDIAVRVPERVSKARACVTESNVREWFQDLRMNLAQLNALDIMNDPTRIFNTDETCIQLAPSTGKVIGERAWKNVYEVAPGPEKSTLTFLGTFSASGETAAPMVIYPYSRIPADICAAVPEEFFIGKSDSGWMKAEVFFEFMANAFNPWLEEKKVKKPVILFVDGHKTHMTLQISTFCQDNGIILYLLPPNTTHMLQPADVGAFRPLKHYWRQQVLDFQRENPNGFVRRRDVAPLLKRVLMSIPKTAIMNGFRACGLYPLDENNVDYTKCLDIHIEREEGLEENIPNSLNYEEARKVLEHELGPDMFQSLQQQCNGESCIEDLEQIP